MLLPGIFNDYHHPLHDSHHHSDCNNYHHSACNVHHYSGPTVVYSLPLPAWLDSEAQFIYDFLQRPTVHLSGYTEVLQSGNDINDHTLTTALLNLHLS